MNDKTIKQNIYSKNDKMFNALLLELDRIKRYVQLGSEPKGEQEQHLYYMIEKESQELIESIEILKEKRTEDYYNYMNK